MEQRDVASCCYHIEYHAALDCSTACFSPVRVRLLVGQAPGGHRAEAGARPRLGVVRVQAGVQRQVRHLLI